MHSSIQKQKLHDHLTRLLARVERRIARRERLSRNFSRARLTLVLVGALATYFFGQQLGATAGWLSFIFFTLAFLFIAQRHERIEQSLARHRIWHRLKAEHIARTSLAWEKLHLPFAQQPSDAAHEVAPTVAPHLCGADKRSALLSSDTSAHPFASDLNLTGERSLLHLLDNTTSTGGSVRLREWLLQPLTAPEHIHARQEIIRELKPLARFRDHLALQGALLKQETHERWHGEKLIAWLERESRQQSLRKWVLGLAALAALNLALFVLHMLKLAPLLWPYTLIAYAYAYVLRFGDLGKLFDEAFLVEQKLRPFQTVARYLEQHPFARHTRLMQLCAPFRQTGLRPSEHLQRAVRIAEGASMQRGQIFWLALNLLLPWDFYFWYRLEKSKEVLKTVLPQWLDAWYELESYNALANFAYLHPDYVFPQIKKEENTALLQAHGLGHPLLPEAARVRNDLTINQLGEIALITGSNMSGKSTFLRAAGVNLVLAHCGAPVCAASLQTAPLRLFTCMAVSDSVTDGISFFYAEVKRLKALLRELERECAAPLFFLVDEIFRGTNNRERLIGSRAYIRSLAQSRGSGMISTHDLELVELEREIASLRNYHFREHVENGRMVFDYLFREGPCPTTNALKVMALEGLPVA